MGIIGIDHVQKSVLDRPANSRPKRKIDLVAVIPVVILVILAIVGPYVVPFSPTTVVGNSYLPPGSTHYFGTDSAGLDVFSRTIAATRLNVFIGIAVAILATVVGVILGTLLGINEPAGGVRGTIARGASRLVDLIQAVPGILIGVVAVAFYGANVTTLILAIAVIVCPLQIRLVRTEVLRVRQEGYVEAAKVAGATPFEAGLRHILPNSVGPALQNMSVLFGIAIIVTAGLGFIGVGLAPPTAEWGSMLAGGATDALQGNWWSAAFPAAFLAFAVTTVAVATRRMFSHSN